MKVSFPFTQPFRFHPESFYTSLNYSDLQNPSIRDRTPIGKGAVLFKMSKFSDSVRITIDLRKTGGIDTLADADIVVPAASRDHFVLFEEFPPNYTKNNAFCEFELWLLNTTPNQTDKSTTVEVQVLYRIK